MFKSIGLIVLYQEINAALIFSIFSISSVLKRTVLSLEVSPLTISIEVFGILKVLERNSTRALFALPSTGCAVIFTLTLPSSFLTISFLEALGEILKFSKKPFSIVQYYHKNVVLMYEIRRFYLKKRNKICMINLL